ncbi:universal stress protein [Actinoplanes sp. CA-142083]|uniref:universal stress protein n=1 Tax=Actinoplanes sp. CA-142083 TaxID=3239903 RepID=UPI003D9110A1
MTGPVIAGAPGAGALALGRWAADTLGVPLIVAVVHPAPAALGSGRVDAEWVADRHRAAEQILDAARSVLGDTDASYRTIASSSAAHGLHDLAEEVGAALIVVGSGKDAPRERLYPGSTAERLLSGSVCPVAVAPAELSPEPGPKGVIGVAYVDTPDGRAALAEAARFAARTGARLRLYTVVASGDASMPFLIGQDAERAFLETARETYERSLDAAVASVPACDADWRILPGDVVDTLADLDEVDVLFCGSRGYGPARRVLLGGVSARLIRRSRRPVVVVPRSG